jgi:membrane dipeptidase
MLKRFFIFFLLSGLFCAKAEAQAPAKGKYLRQAKKILKTTPIADTHVDFPWHMADKKKWYKPGHTAWALKNPDGDFDYERAKKGGLSAPFMSIYIPAHFQKEAGRSRQVADSLIGLVDAVIKDHPGKFAYAKRAAEVETNFAKGLISLPMGMENGSPIEKIEDVAYFYGRGINYVTLTHGRDNQISDSSYDTLNTHGGLSAFGREVVREMNRVGIMVDVSHLSDNAIWDVLETARKPLIASHSACRHYTPGFQRNLSDTLIRAVARTGGVVQVPFSFYFLSTDSRKAMTAANAEMKEKKVPEDGPEAKYFMSQFILRQGAPMFLSVRHVADHIDYIVRIAGIDHVGIGSDFDGVGVTLPTDLADVGMYPNLIAELLRRGYKTADIKKICYQNTLRVWKANEVARE